MRQRILSRSAAGPLNLHRWFLILLTKRPSIFADVNTLLTFAEALLTLLLLCRFLGSFTMYMLFKPGLDDLSVFEKALVSGINSQLQISQLLVCLVYLQTQFGD